HCNQLWRSSRVVAPSVPVCASASSTSRMRWMASRSFMTKGRMTSRSVSKGGTCIHPSLRYATLRPQHILAGAVVDEYTQCRHVPASPQPSRNPPVLRPHYVVLVWRGGHM